uniref:Ricin B, lectin domain, glycoside hydrolase, family 5 n=1 Tax=Tanacetum cinerariifolium TaxID=118510 RepID=A0A6L2N4R9_TANCI|nr:ricin B, lectin domain, glycoside hydrolase, family 5 [Tanacetum cinerariifolium]
MEEFYGVLNWNWHEARNSSFLKKISPLQSPFQAPILSTNGQHKVIFHPSTGLCVQSKSLRLGPCSNAEAWDYTSQNKLTMKSTGYCLQANGVHMPVKVDTACEDVSSAWEAILASQMHLSTKINNGTMGKALSFFRKGGVATSGVFTIRDMGCLVLWGSRNHGVRCGLQGLMGKLG